MPNMLRDADFKGGFRLFCGYSEKGGAKDSGEIISFEAGNKCEWVLHELNSRYFLKSSDKKTVPGGAEYSNGLKKVARILNDKGEAEIFWCVYAENDYAEPRKKTDIPWVHLMSEQSFPKPLAFKNHEKFIFRTEVKLDGFKNCLSEEDYLPEIQAAQTNMYHIVKNYNKKSADYMKFMWYGVNIYDNRYEIHPGTNMFDEGFAGATHTIIYVSEGEKTYGGATPHDGFWHSIEIDIKRELETCLREAQRMGLMKDTESEDLGIENFYISSEVSGTFNMELRFKNLEFCAE